MTKYSSLGVIDAKSSAIVVVNHGGHQFDYESFTEVFCGLPRTKKTLYRIREESGKRGYSWAGMVFGGSRDSIRRRALRRRFFTNRKSVGA